MWGNGFFFHPDERNMAVAIAQMRVEDNLHPHFFAYGQFPLYLVYFSYQITQFILNLWHLPSITQLLNYSITSVPFGHGVFWLRFWSALASTLTIPVVYLIMKELTNKHQTPNYKSQTSTKHQITNLKKKRGLSDYLKIGNWKLFENWKLSRGAGSRFAGEIGNYAALLVAFTPALIQAAHFGTTESLLTFFFMLIIYLSLKFLKTENLKYLLLMGIASGIAMGTKVSAAFFVFAPILSIIIVSKNKKGSILKTLGKLFLFFAVFCFLFFVFCLLASPYNFLAFKDFLGTSTYETHVAQGKSLAFYTDQFEKTTPVLYQLTRIFPYALGWPMFIIGTVGFLYINLQLGTRFLFPLLAKIKNLKLKVQSYNVKLKNFRFDMSFFIFSFSFLVYFIPNAFLFCKWTRFITPIMPFFAIFGSIAVFQIFNFLKKFYQETQSAKLKAQSYSLKLKTFNFLVVVFSFSLLAFSLIPGLLFFTIYLKPDVRIEASKWIYQNIAENAYILSETANVIDIPVQPKTYNLEPRIYHVISFNFYDLDKNNEIFEKLINHLEKADYIFIPSHRIFANRLRLAEKYPLTAQYYNLLFSGQLGFEKVAHFSRLPDEQAEETWSVFDHPAIRVYKKVKPYTKVEYKDLLELH